LVLTPDIRMQITGVVLAGGRATRMGGSDKGLIRLGTRTMAEHVLHALRPQVSDLLINANRNLDIYRRFGCPVIADAMDGYCGPLAGMASALRVARTPLLLTVPCDSPFVPVCLAERLHAGMVGQDAEIAVAESGGRLEPVFALIQTALYDSLLDFLNAGERKIDRWYARHRMTAIDFSDLPDAFRNINTPADVDAAAARLATIPA